MNIVVNDYTALAIQFFLSHMFLWPTYDILIHSFCNIYLTHSLSPAHPLYISCDFSRFYKENNWGWTWWIPTRLSTLPNLVNSYFKNRCHRYKRKRHFTTSQLVWQHLRFRNYFWWRLWRTISDQLLCFYSLRMNRKKTSYSSASCVLSNKHLSIIYCSVYQTLHLCFLRQVQLYEWLLKTSIVLTCLMDVG